MNQYNFPDAKGHFGPYGGVFVAETLFAALFGAWWLGERLDGQGWLGCGLILGALLAVQLLPLLHNRLKAGRAGSGAVLP